MPLETVTALAVEEAASIEALEALRLEWDALWEACPTATPFQSPAWLIPWWRHIGKGGLWTLALREEGRLVGLAPLYIYSAPGEGLRQVFPLGIATTDYLDALFLPGWEARGMAAVFAHLEEWRDRWDVCEWPQLRPASPLLQAPCPPGWREAMGEAEPCPVLPLPAGLDSVPGAMRKNLRYYRRRAERAGEMRLEEAGPESWEEVFEAVLALHRARWKTRREPGVLADPGVQAAHRESVPALLKRGLLRLFTLRLGTEVAAVYYGLMDRPGPERRAYYYLGGFDPAREDLSLGTLLIGHAVEDAVRRGARSFDFLRGREGYKYLWGACDETTYRRRLWHEGSP